MVELFPATVPSGLGDGELLTLREAARLLKLSTVTLQRWIRQGRLPAYQVGPRKVRILRGDLDKVLRPAQREGVRHTKEAITTLSVPPLNNEQVQEALEALRQADAIIEAIRARRKGKPLESSAPVIRRAREERSKHLL